MKYFIVSVDDNFKDTDLSEYFSCTSGRYSDGAENMCEIHRVGARGALSESLAKQIRVELGKMILQGKCRTWNEVKFDMGVLP